MSQLALALKPGQPLNRAVYAALRQRILEGSISSGRLPSSRALAEELCVSRNTVLFAYEQLAAEGYVETRRGAGTFVVPAVKTRSQAKHQQVGTRAGARHRSSRLGARLAAYGSEATRTERKPLKPVPYDLRSAGSGYDRWTLNAWARLLARHARNLPRALPGYQLPGGFSGLREALADYLARARGLDCAPEQVIVTQGSQQGIDLCLRLFVDPGDAVVLEEPHWTGYSHCLAACGARVVYVPADSQGMQVEQLENHADAKVVCVTPSHQFPAGGVMPLRRRLHLLDWAQRHRAAILEDDYDSEFRYEGRPIECLHGLDGDGRVIYLGSASRMLFPALRIGWAVVPAALSRTFGQLKAITDRDTPSLEQLAFADFIREGLLERHVRRARKRLASRRSALLEALGRELHERAEVTGASAGIHVLLRLRELPRTAFAPLRHACLARGIRIYSAAPNYAQLPAHVELLVGYASIPEEDITSAISGLREALDSLASP